MPIPIYAFVIAGQASMFHPEDFSPAIHTKSPYVCAMNPPVQPGDQVFVVNSDNGKTSHCIVTGGGPYYGGRIFDASPRVADELGYGDGLGNVRVYKITGYFCQFKDKPKPVTCKVPPPICVVDLPKPIFVTQPCAKR